MAKYITVEALQDIHNEQEWIERAYSFLEDIKKISEKRDEKKFKIKLNSIHRDLRRIYQCERHIWKNKNILMKALKSLHHREKVFVLHMGEFHIDRVEEMLEIYSNLLLAHLAKNGILRKMILDSGVHSLMEESIPFKGILEEIELIKSEGIAPLIALFKQLINPLEDLELQEKYSYDLEKLGFSRKNIGEVAYSVYKEILLTRWDSLTLRLLKQPELARAVFKEGIPAIDKVLGMHKRKEGPTYYKVAKNFIRRGHDFKWNRNDLSEYLDDIIYLGGKIAKLPLSKKQGVFNIVGMVYAKVIRGYPRLVRNPHVWSDLIYVLPIIVKSFHTKAALKKYLREDFNQEIIEKLGLQDSKESPQGRKKHYREERFFDDISREGAFGLYGARYKKNS